MDSTPPRQKVTCITFQTEVLEICGLNYFFEVFLKW